MVNKENNSDKPSVKAEETAQPQGQQQSDAPAITIRGQYIKDLSFESPNAPQNFLTPVNDAPQIDIAIDVAADKLQDDNYEVILNLSVKALQKDATLFVAELSYAGVFTLQNIPEKNIEASLLIYCPSVLFPFARRIIADATRDGGFHPLMIDPIDFSVLYQRRRQQQQQQANAASEDKKQASDNS